MKLLTAVVAAQLLLACLTCWAAGAPEDSEPQWRYCLQTGLAHLLDFRGRWTSEFRPGGEAALASFTSEVLNWRVEVGTVGSGDCGEDGAAEDACRKEIVIHFRGVPRCPTDTRVSIRGRSVRVVQLDTDGRNSSRTVAELRLGGDSEGDDDDDRLPASVPLLLRSFDSGRQHSLHLSGTGLHLRWSDDGFLALLLESSSAAAAASSTGRTGGWCAGERPPPAPREGRTAAKRRRVRPANRGPCGRLDRPDGRLARSCLRDPFVEVAGSAAAYATARRFLLSSRGRDCNSGGRSGAACRDGRAVLSLCHRRCPDRCAALRRLPPLMCALAPLCACAPPRLLDSRGRCVEEAECPCRHGNRIYHRGERFTKDCQTCSCLGNNNWRCASSDCGRVCLATPGQVVTFDGQKISFVDKRNDYYLIEPDDSKIPLAVKFSRSSPARLEVSWQGQQVLVYHRPATDSESGDFVIQLGDRSQKLAIGEHLRVGLGFFLHRVTSHYIRLRVADLLRVDFNGGTVELAASRRLRGARRLRGLCGRYDGSSENDLWPRRGRAAADSLSVARSYLVKAISPAGGPKRTTISREAVRTCYDLFQHSGQFQRCARTENLQPFLRNCEAAGDRDSVCYIAFNAMRLCARSGYKIHWRLLPQLRNCALLACPRGGSSFRLCANTCQATCASLARPDRCPSGCYFGCQCPRGRYLMADGRCVTKSQCTCFDSATGRQRQPGEKFSRRNENCKCQDGRAVCQAAQSASADGRVACPKNQVWRRAQPGECWPRRCEDPVKDGSRCQSPDSAAEERCRCPAGLFATDSGLCVNRSDCPCRYGGRELLTGSVLTAQCPGRVCSSGRWLNRAASESSSDSGCRGRCRAFGDGYYVSFDGRAFRYYAGSLETLLLQLPQLRVATRSVACGSSRPSVCARLVKIRLAGGDEIRVLQGRIIAGLRHVDGEAVVLTATAALGGLHFLRIGVSIVWDRGTRLTINAARPRSGQPIGGLCGNFNGDATDDYRTPGGLLALSPDEFGRSWTLESDYAQPIPESEYDQGCLKSRENFDWSFARCGLLRDQRGPFGRCLSVLNEDRLEFLHDACLREACRCRRTVKDAANCDGLCNLMAAAADECAGLNVTVDWRSAAFCPYNCPEGTAYTSCGQLQSPFVFANGPDVQCLEDCRCRMGGQWTQAAGSCTEASHVCRYRAAVYQTGDSAKLGCRQCTCREGKWIRCDNKDCYRNTTIELNNLSTVAPCTGHSFACRNSDACLHRSKVCDGVPDCSDGSDEMSCEGCPAFKLKCRRSNLCIAKSEVCDGKHQCRLGNSTDDSDEENCATGATTSAPQKKPIEGTDSCYRPLLQSGLIKESQVRITENFAPTHGYRRAELLDSRKRPYLLSKGRTVFELRLSPAGSAVRVSSVLLQIQSNHRRGLKAIRLYANSNKTWQLLEAKESNIACTRCLIKLNKLPFAAEKLKFKIQSRSSMKIQLEINGCPGQNLESGRCRRLPATACNVKVYKSITYNREYSGEEKSRLVLPRTEYSLLKQGSSEIVIGVPEMVRICAVIIKSKLPSDGKPTANVVSFVYDKKLSELTLVSKLPISTNTTTITISKPTNEYKAVLYSKDPIRISIEIQVKKQPVTKNEPKQQKIACKGSLPDSEVSGKVRVLRMTALDSRQEYTQSDRRQLLRKGAALSSGRTDVLVQFSLKQTDVIEALQVLTTTPGADAKVTARELQLCTRDRCSKVKMSTPSVQQTNMVIRARARFLKIILDSPTSRYAKNAKLKFDFCSRNKPHVCKERYLERCNVPLMKSITFGKRYDAYTVKALLQGRPVRLLRGYTKITLINLNLAESVILKKTGGRRPLKLIISLTTTNERKRKTTITKFDTVYSAKLPTGYTKMIITIKSKEPSKLALFKKECQKPNKIPNREPKTAAHTTTIAPATTTLEPTKRPTTASTAAAKTTKAPVLTTTTKRRRVCKKKMAFDSNVLRPEDVVEVKRVPQNEPYDEPEKKSLLPGRRGLPLRKGDTLVRIDLSRLPEGSRVAEIKVSADKPKRITKVSVTEVTNNERTPVGKAEQPGDEPLSRDDLESIPLTPTRRTPDLIEVRIRRGSKRPSG
ncbi:hypothetical protein BOX15_Mlig010037g1 [Macrostomum lignano]|uniref:VWFD domain-containing protein n=1 Tax=Macrostomum lignano TaxID=282301 RepID=A0A267GJ42_9PLAT|nr:hypothetical protein BOX15_Mlig010037g1 [Macrostomum lignano]